MAGHSKEDAMRTTDAGWLAVDVDAVDELAQVSLGKVGTGGSTAHVAVVVLPGAAVIPGGGFEDGTHFMTEIPPNSVPPRTFSPPV